MPNPRRRQAPDTPALRKRQLAAIHIAASAFGLDDETYRDMLEGLTGKRSSADMSAEERDRLLCSIVRGHGGQITPAAVCGGCL